MTLRIDLDHFRARILQDALTEATAAYWEHRARQFDDAAPRPDDYQGRADPGDLVDRAIRCRQTADNCRNHARIVAEETDPAPDVWAAVLKELN